MNKMNTTEIQNLMNLLTNIESKLDALLGTSTSSSKEVKEVKKTRKPRDPDAPKSDWQEFLTLVRALLKEEGKPAGAVAMQFASHLKTEFPDTFLSLNKEEILAAHESWVPPPQKPREKKAKQEKPVEKPAEKSDSEAKPKRTLSQEQKDKMAEGKRKKAAQRKAEKEAAAAEPQSEPEAAPVAKPTPNLRPLPLGGKRYLWDPEGNGLWKLEADKSKGAWVGMLTKDKKIDQTGQDYTA